MDRFVFSDDDRLAINLGEIAKVRYIPESKEFPFLVSLKCGIQTSYSEIFGLKIMKALVAFNKELKNGKTV